MGVAGGLLAGVYGGYFGAAQGVLLMAILGIGVADSMQRHNATKNVLALLVNGDRRDRVHLAAPTSTCPSCPTVQPTASTGRRPA